VKGWPLRRWGFFELTVWLFVWTTLAVRARWGFLAVWPPWLNGLGGAFGLWMWKLAISTWASEFAVWPYGHLATWTFRLLYELNAWVKRCYCSVDEKVRSQHLVQVNLVTGRRRRVVGERGNDFSSSTWGLEISFFLSRRILITGNNYVEIFKIEILYLVSVFFLFFLH